MLTEKQSQLLRLIDARLRKTGISPSFDEMKDALDLKSKSGIHRLISGLVERGFIRRIPNRARAIEVLRLPESAAADAPTVKAIRQAVVARPTNPVGILDMAFVPLMGRIAAGTPVSAIQHTTRSIPVAAEMLAPGEHFALEVRGDSMVDAGILDGDTVIVRKVDTANTGDIVVALVDDEEATLKRFRRRGATISLEPANSSYETRILGHRRVKVQGVLAGLIRSY